MSKTFSNIGYIPKATKERAIVVKAIGSKAEPEKAWYEASNNWISSTDP